MKRYISLISALSVLTGMMSGFVAANAAADGNGTEIDPYVVSTAEEWESAKKQGYIQLGADITTTVGPRTAADLTVDLHGHTLTSSAASVLEVYGGHTFTLVDTGSTKGALVNSGTGYGIKVAANNATANINGASVRSKGQAVLVSAATAPTLNLENAIIDGGTYAINVASGGIVNIKSATINNDAEYKGYTIYAQGSSVVTVDDGTFHYNGTVSSVVVSGNASVTINGGTFYNPNTKRGVINNAKGYTGTLTINGGVFENTYEGIGYSILDGDEGTTDTPPSIIIKGGNFNSIFGRVKPNNTKTQVLIEGGTFVFDPASYVNTGYSKITDNGNGTWTVTSDGETPATTSPENTQSPDPGATAAPTALPTASPTPTPSPTSTPTAKPIVTQPPSEGTVWAEKWSYNFNEFTSTDTYSSSNKLTLPGEKAPSITFYKGTITCAEGLFGKSEGDYHLALTSSTSGESARIFHDISNLDAPVNNLIAEMDMAFSTTTETRYLASYRTTGSMNGMVFSADGRVGYYDSSNKIQYFEGLTYKADKWYHIAVKYDFINKTISYYLDDEYLGTVTPPNAAAMTTVSEICYKGIPNKNDPGTTYMDNFKISQEQESYITSVLTSPVSRTYLRDTEITFTGYAKDSTGAGIERTEFYVDGEMVHSTESDTYSFTKKIEPGNHTLIARSINRDGFTGDSKTVNFTVAGYDLPTVYSDGMVLQRNKPVKIAGKGINGTMVTASVQGRSASAKVEDGNFEITLPSLSASKSETLKVEADGIEKTYNVAIGEVILLNGQSNIAYNLSQFTQLRDHYTEDRKDIHLFKQDSVSLNTPQTDIPSGRWVPGTISEATYFSGFGFGTAVDLYKALGEDVPIGLIYAAIGGTNINTWVKNGAYTTDPDLAAINTNSKAYNQMVAPLTAYTIGHVIWYQGEANTYINQNYEKALTKYIDSLREDFNDESIDFTIIQLPIYNYTTAYKTVQRTATEVRAAEWNVSERLDNVATIVAIDTGDAGGIHPNDKLTIIPRVVKALLHFIDPDDDSIIYKSPSYKAYTQDGSTMTITFKDVAGGLTTKDGAAPKGFKIAGDDNNFVDADVTLKDNTIIIDTSSVTGTPKVRYAWEDCPALGADNKTTTLNLVNSEGLPMAPFRTDTDRYQFKVVSATELGDPVNFAPMIRKVTADSSGVITVNARDYDDEIATVEVFVDNNSIGMAEKVSDDEYEITWNSATEGTHEVYAIATDTLGTTSTKQHESLGTRTTAPVKYSIVFKAGTATPTAESTATPTAEPTATPTTEPTATPTAEPTATPTAEPTATPMTEPTTEPTQEPTTKPSEEPTPTQEPTVDEHIWEFTDREGNVIESFADADGVRVKAAESGNMLIIAAYKDDRMISCTVSYSDSAELTAEQIADADTVKSFLFDAETTLKPLADALKIFR